MDRYKIDCCTKDCPDRSGVCHGTCKEYKKQRAELDETNKKQNQKKKIKAGLDANLYASVERTAKRTNYRDRKGK